MQCNETIAQYNSRDGQSESSGRMVSDHCKWTAPVQKLEQLECLSSEDTPCRLMKTHTIESYWIPSQKKTVKVTNLKN